MTGWRTDPAESDPQAIDTLVRETGFFSDEERAVAVELVSEALARGSASGYAFVFADSTDDPRRLLGYTCYGPIPATQSSFDLYWIAVAPAGQRQGLGSELLRATERLARAAGATRMYVDTSGRAQYAPTRAFYERAGYRPAAVLEDFYAPGDSKVLYARTL